MASYFSLIESKYIEKHILPFIGFIILFLPEFYIYSRKLNINMTQSNFGNWMAFLFKRLYKYLKLIIYNLLSLYIILICLLVLQHLSLVGPGLWLDSMFSGVVNNIVNTTILYNDKPLEVISGNKFSFSGILFTLGIGGTVIFSLVDYYNQQNEIIDRNTLDIIRYYQKWFKLNNNNNILNFDPTKYDEFNESVNTLRGKFHQYVKIKNYIWSYNFAIFSISLMYVMGIFVVIGSDLIVESIFIMFPLISIIFIIIIYLIFKYFNNSSSPISNEMESLPFNVQTPYEFIDDTQSIHDNEKINQNVLEKKNQK